jgi:S1-C subfamily serine protease
VKPAVVQITSERSAVDPFNQPYSVPAGVGSGVIYDPQGYILTNNHVLDGAQRLLVSLPDDRAFPGRLVGGDPPTDLAVVQIDAADLPVAPLGDSDQLQVGDWVVAIGNALGLPGGPTVTAGVVSALGRTLQEPTTRTGRTGPFLFDLIQTDTAVNPGNSGGPLVDLDGQVVGINSILAGQAEPGVQAQGIGFAIATAVARPVAEQLVQVGRVSHAYLGISYVPLTPALAAQLGIKEKSGVVVAQVMDRSPAAAAGLKARDVLTEVDGTPVKGDSALARLLSKHRPGDTLALSVSRDGVAMRILITVGELPAS